MATLVQLRLLASQRTIAGDVFEILAVSQVAAIVRGKQDQSAARDPRLFQCLHDPPHALVKRFDHRFHMRRHISGVRNDSPFVFVITQSLASMWWIAGPLPWKVDCQMGQVQKERLVSVPLDEINAVVGQQLRRIASLHFNLIIMTTVFVARTVDVGVLIAVARTETSKDVEDLTGW